MKAMTDALNRHILRLAEALAEGPPVSSLDESCLLARRLLSLFQERRNLRAGVGHREKPQSAP